MKIKSSIKSVVKISARKAWKYGKKNSYIRQTKEKLVGSLEHYLNRNNQEVYEVGTHYPSIKNYYKQQNTNFDKQPLISILLPTYNTPEIYLRECIESILFQSYGNWELCIADDNSPDPEVVKIIKSYQKADKRIKFTKRTENGHISEATNTALSMAKGEYVALMDHDDVLWPNALFEMVAQINAEPDVDMIYSDEDKINGEGDVHSYPFLKPDFSPEFLESCNYITHFSCIRKDIMDEIGGFRKGYEGAQDWDLFIRISEITSKIRHIPKILYSWRIHELSTASDTDAKPYVYEAQLKLLKDHIDRTGRPGVVETGIIRQHRTIKYTPVGTLSLVILSTSHDNTMRLLDSFKLNSPGARFELIVVGGDSTDYSHYEFDFGYGPVTPMFTDSVQDVKTASSTVLVAHDSVVVDSDNWARIMLADSETRGVAAVFPLILKSDSDTIESAGIGVGYGSTGGAQMLQGFPFLDDHYTRGLYAKSRRNVSAGNDVFFAVKRDLFINHLVGRSSTSFVSECVELSKRYRHIYTPYVRVRSQQPIPDVLLDLIGDKYLNTNFKAENGSMEVSR